MGFHSPCEQCWCSTLKQVTAVFFSNSFTFINYLIIRRCIPYIQKFCYNSEQINFRDFII